MTATADPAALLDVLRDELKALKDEQRGRIHSRDGLIYSIILACVAAAGSVRYAGAVWLLLLPPIVLALGWTYLTNDRAVSAIGAYLRDDLGPRLSTLTGDEVLRWETCHRDDRRRRQRKTIQLGVDLLVCVLPGAVAVVGYWTTGPANPLLLAVSVAEAAAVLVAGWQVVSYAEIRTR